MPASPNNYALAFDGGDRTINIGSGLSLRNLGSFTWEGWIKPDMTSPGSGNRRLWVEQQGGSYQLIRFAVCAIKGLLRFELSPKDGRADTNYNYSITWPTDRWQHVAFAANIGGETYHIYLNGQEVASGTLVVPEDVSVIQDTAPQRIRMGGYALDGTNYTYWHGRLDDVRIWKEVRTQQQIADNRFLHIDPTTANLMENIRFNEGTGTTIYGSVDSDPGTGGTQLRSWTIPSSAMWIVDRPFLGDIDGDADADFDVTAPSIPASLTASAITSTTMTLSWAASTDDVYVQGYQLAIATDSGFTSHVSGYANRDVEGVVTWNVSGLVPATNYYARVRAYDAENNLSGWRNASAFPIVTNTAGDITPPNAPNAASATSVTYLGFTANWDVATDPGVGATGVSGYKLDVAYDSDFLSFFPGFRNLDVGNVTHYPVVTGEWSTTFYYRTRAYDGAENESIDSNTITVTTSPPPDTTPPNMVILQEATGVGATVFTANWEEAYDNVGVTGYRLDVSLVDDFASYVSGYQNLDVGLVTAYGIEGLTPETSYFYRTRAYDASGNTGTHETEPTQVITLPYTIAEGGPQTLVLIATEDAHVDSGTASTSYGSDSTLQVVGSGAANVKIAYLKFDLSDVIGTVQDATLRLFVTEPSAGSYSVYGPLSNSWDETVTWNTRPALSGTPVTFTPTNDEQWIDIPVISLITNGNVTYTLAVATISSDNANFNSSEATTGQPELQLEINPNDGTQTSDLQLESETVTLKNWLANGSAEGTLTGTVDSTGSATVSQDNTHVFHGAQAAKVITSGGVANSGVLFKSLAGLGLTGSARSFTSAIQLYAESAFTLAEVFLQFKYTDLTTADSTIAANIRVQPGWTRVEIPTLTSNPSKTIDRIDVVARTGTALSATFWADAAIVVEGTTVPPHFDGNTVLGSVSADWEGSQNQSASTITLPRILVEAAYIGDGDEDNSAITRYKRVTSSVFEWIRPSTLTTSINRIAKQAESTIGPVYYGNLAKNPSGELGTDGWSGDTATISQDTDIFEEGAASVAAVVTGANQGGRYRDAIRASASEDFAVSARVHIPSGMDVYIAIAAYNSSGAEISNSGQSAFIAGNDDWQTLSTTWTLPANTVEMGVLVKTTTGSAVSGTFRIDELQINKGTVVLPYIDGTLEDGYWEGLVHKSATLRILTPEVSYDVEVEFSDNEGVAGTNPVSEAVIAAKAPDNALTVTSISLVPSNTTITVSIPYSGDDDENASVTLQFKREDLTSWSTISTTWDRQSKLITATLFDLNPGTAYDVQATFFDSTAVYGINPITGNSVTTTVGLLAETEPRILFGGFVLNGREDGKIWVTTHNGLGLPNREVQTEPLARIDGAVETNNQWRTRDISITGVVEGDTRAELLGNLRMLKQALAKAKQRLVIDTMAKTGHYFIATLESFASSEIAGETFRHVVWDAEFICADPFAYEATETADNDSSVNNGDYLSAQNDGDVIVEPLFRVTVSGNVDTTITIFNETTGERITPSATFKSGDVLLVNSELLSCRKNGVEIDFLGGFPRLAVGANKVYFYTTPTDRVLNVQVRRRHRYL